EASAGVDHQRGSRDALGQIGSQQAKDAGTLLLEVLPSAGVDVNVQVFNGGNVLLLRFRHQRSPRAIDVEVDVLVFVLASGPRLRLLRVGEGARLGFPVRYDGRENERPAGAVVV